MATPTQSETFSLSTIMTDPANAKLVAEVSALQESEVMRLMGGVVPDLINKTVLVGLEAISDPELQDKIRKNVQGVDLDKVLELKSIVASYIKVATAAIKTTPKSPLRAYLDEAVPLKRKITSELVTCAEFGLIPQDKVDNYKAGKGITDMAHDLIDGAAMLRAVDRSKSRLTDTDLDRAQKLGELIMANSKPTAANVPSLSEKAQTADIRDRIYTLIVRRYSDLRCAAYYLWRDDFGDHVPPLATRKRTAKAA